MHSCHAKSPCCQAKIYHFGSRRRQCSQCKRTWRIRKKRRGGKPRRTRPGVLKAVLLDGRTLKTLAPRYGLTHQALTRRFRRGLRYFVSRSRVLRLPRGPLVLVLDGLYFRFRAKDWVLYVMAVKPCHQNRAVFLDPVLLPGRENMQGWSQAFTTIPASIHRRIRASGLRRDFGNYPAWYGPGLDRATLPFSSYQSIAELPRSKHSQLAGQTLARSALSTCPASSGVARWPQVANRAQKTEASCSASNRTARHAHDRSGVSQTHRPFQSLSKISRTRSANYYGQRRSNEPQSS